MLFNQFFSSATKSFKALAWIHDPPVVERFTRRFVGDSHEVLPSSDGLTGLLTPVQVPLYISLPNPIQARYSTGRLCGRMKVFTDWKQL